MNKMFTLLAIVTIASAGCTPVQRRPAVETIESSLFLPTFIKADPVAMGNGQKYLELFQAAGGPKGKYETDDAYAARLKAKLPEKISIDIPLSDIDFKVDSATGKVRVSQFLTDGAFLGFPKEGETGCIPTLEASSKVDSSRSYVGQNAMGAQALVHQANLTRISVAVAKLYRPFCTELQTLETGPLSTPASEIEHHERDFMIRLVGVPKPPYMVVGGNYGKPTIANPSENIFDNYIIPMGVAGAYLVNVKTGKVDLAEVYLKARRTVLNF